MLKNLIVFTLSFLYFPVQAERVSSLFLNSDSLRRPALPLNNGWRYAAGDDTARAFPGFDDSAWKTGTTDPRLPEDTFIASAGIAWFRLHVVIDSSIAGRQLALTITHPGASQIFIDGLLVQSFGTIAGPDNSLYSDPQEMPFLVQFHGAGPHVLAVRYANFDAKKNYRLFKARTTGFRMTIGDSDSQTRLKDSRTAIFSTILMFLSGMFLALGVTHFLMYLYYKSSRSSLFFSLLMFSLSLCLIIALLSYIVHRPSLQVRLAFLLNPLIITACLSLSGFTNELFYKNKLRFRILCAAGLTAFLLYLFAPTASAMMIIGLIIVISLEAVITIVIGILRKIPGSRIIGTGILFFVLFLLFNFVIVFSKKGQHLNIDDSTVGGQVYLVLLVLAILSIPLSMSVYLAWNFSTVRRHLQLRLEEVNELSRKNLEQEKEKQRLLESRKSELEHEVSERTAELRNEMKKSQDLLLNILPAEVAEELKATGKASAKTFSLVTVMFMDFKDFSQVSEKISAELLVAEIDACFSAFDRIVQRGGIEKIKTIGDAYICAAGLPVSNYTHATDSVQAAFEILRFMEERKKAKTARGEIPFEIRIGIHTGPVVAGIVGIKKFAYDIWGDTVNLAARMEQNSEAGRINISGTTYSLVKERFQCTHRGKIQAKNKGELDMYFVEGPAS